MPKKRLTRSVTGSSNTPVRGYKTTNRSLIKQTKGKNNQDVIAIRSLEEWDDFEAKTMGRLVSVSQMQLEANLQNLGDDEEPKTYKCAFCKKTFKLSTQLITHNLKHLEVADLKILKDDKHDFKENSDVTSTPENNNKGKKTKIEKVTKKTPQSKKVNKKINTLSDDTKNKNDEIKKSEEDEQYSLLERNLARIVNMPSKPKDSRKNSVNLDLKDKHVIQKSKVDDDDLCQNKDQVLNIESINKDDLELIGSDPVQVFTKSRRKVAKYSCKHCNKEFSCKEILHEHVYERVCLNTPTKPKKRKLENNTIQPEVEVKEDLPEVKDKLPKVDQKISKYEVSIEITDASNNTTHKDIQSSGKTENDREQLAKVLQEFSENCISPVKNTEYSSPVKGTEYFSPIKNTEKEMDKEIPIKKSIKKRLEEIDAFTVKKSTPKKNNEKTKKPNSIKEKRIATSNQIEENIEKKIDKVIKEKKFQKENPVTPTFSSKKQPPEQFNNAFLDFLTANNVKVPTKENMPKTNESDNKNKLKTKSKIKVNAESKIEIPKLKTVTPKLKTGTPKVNTKTKVEPKVISDKKAKLKNINQNDESFEKSESDLDADFSPSDDEYLPEETVELKTKHMSTRDINERKPPKRISEIETPKRPKQTIDEDNIPVPVKIPKILAPKISNRSDSIRPIENPVCNGTKQCVLCPCKQFSDCQMTKHMADYHNVREPHDCPSKTRCKELVSCAICGLVLTNFKLKSHVEDSHFSRITIFSCPLCKGGQLFNVRKSLKMHLKKVHNIDNVAENNNAYAGLSSQKCDLCSANFFSQCDLTVHKRYQRRHFIIRCSECKLEFCDAVTMTNHFDNTHLHKCGYCNKKFRYMLEVAEHVFSVHPTSEFDNELPPEESQKEAPQEKVRVEGLNNDRVILRGKDDTFVCKPCKRVFETRNATFRHFVLKHSNLTFCTQCDKKLYTHAEMLPHVKRVHDKNFIGFWCFMCELNFGKLADKLVNHLRKVHEVPEALLY